MCPHPSYNENGAEADLGFFANLVPHLPQINNQKMCQVPQATYLCDLNTDFGGTGLRSLPYSDDNLSTMITGKKDLLDQ